MAGLGKLKHDPAAVVGIAGNYGQTVVVFCIQLEIFFINLGNVFYRHNTTAVYNSHMQGIFQIVIDGMLCNFPRQSRHLTFQKIVVIENQGLVIQIMKPLQIKQFCALREAGALAEGCICCDFSKQKNLCFCCLVIAPGRFLKAFDFTQGKGGLFNRPVNIANALALNRLHIAVCNKTSNCPAYRVSGTVIKLNQ